MFLASVEAEREAGERVVRFEDGDNLLYLDVVWAEFGALAGRYPIVDVEVILLLVALGALARERVQELLLHLRAPSKEMHRGLLLSKGGVEKEVLLDASFDFGAFASVEGGKRALDWFKNACTVKGKRERMLSVVRQRGLLLENVPPEFIQDQEIVLAALTENVNALMFAPLSLTRDLEFMSKAVVVNGLALQYASPELLENADLVRRALAQRRARLCVNEHQVRSLLWFTY
jgi:hypothetical protein